MVARTLGHSNTPDREAEDPVPRLLWPSGIYFECRSEEEEEQILLGRIRLISLSMVAGYGDGCERYVNQQVHNRWQICSERDEVEHNLIHVAFCSIAALSNIIASRNKGQQVGRKDNVRAA